MVGITCYKCGILFGVPEHWQITRLEDHADFYCPNGHKQAYLGKSTSEKLRERAERAERERDMAREQRDASRSLAKHQIRALRGHVTRLKRARAA